MASGAHPRRLETLAQEAAFKLKRSKEYLASASILLAACKRRVDAGDPDAEGASWTDYCPFPGVFPEPYSQARPHGLAAGLSGR